MKRKNIAKSRRAVGSIILLMIASAAFSTFVGLAAVNYISLIRCKNLLQSAADAGALMAASDLSQIVVEDPTRGYVALTDHPAADNDLKAADGEPLPVLSINTLMATARLDLIVSSKLGLAQMSEFAKNDARVTLMAAKKLSNTFREAIKQDNGSMGAHDVHGKPVNVLQDIRKSVEVNLRNSSLIQLEHIDTQIGAYSSACTTTAIPQPLASSTVPPELQQRGNYRAFVNVPYGGEEFRFLAVSDSAKLIRVDELQSTKDGLASLVQVRVSCSIKPLVPGFGFQPWSMSAEATAVPSAVPDKSPSGDLLINIANRDVANSLLDLLLASSLGSGNSRIQVAQGGDFPSDASASLNNLASGLYVPQADPLSLGIYCWIRNLGPRVRIDSLVDALNRRLSDVSDSSFAAILFEQNRDNTISLSPLSQTPFPIACVSDGQMFGTQSFNAGGNLLQVRIYNQVLRNENFYNTKHGGQPLCGDPIDWCELKSFGRSQAEQFSRGRGSDYLKVSLTENLDDHKDRSTGIFRYDCQIADMKGRPVDLRKSLVSGGLACAVDLY